MNRGADNIDLWRGHHDIHIPRCRHIPQSTRQERQKWKDANEGMTRCMNKNEKNPSNGRTCNVQFFLSFQIPRKEDR